MTFPKCVVGCNRASIVAPVAHSDRIRTQLMLRINALFPMRKIKSECLAVYTPLAELSFFFNESRQSHTGKSLENDICKRAHIIRLR